MTLKIKIFQCFLWNIFPEIKSPCSLFLSLRHCSNLSSTNELKTFFLISYMYSWNRSSVSFFQYSYPPVSKMLQPTMVTYFRGFVSPFRKNIEISSRPGQDGWLQNPFPSHPSSVTLLFEETRYWQRCVTYYIVQVMSSRKYFGREWYSQAYIF